MSAPATRYRVAATSILAFVGLLLSSQETFAHSFGRSYNLPIPVWMYLYGAAAALILSFAVAAFFLKPKPARALPQLVLSPPLCIARFQLRPLKHLARAITLALLLLCIVSGYIGSHSPYRNINMSLFWIVFVLGLTWLVAIIGDVYSVLNPWRTLCNILSNAIPKKRQQPLIAYPRTLSYWPALLLYMVFIWIELFRYNTPLGLSQLLLGYTAYNIVGAALFGRHSWFTYLEWFSVFFRLLGQMAAADIRPNKPIILRIPFSACAKNSPSGLSAVVFILFMLSSTAFDGLHETTVWQRLYWIDFYSAIAGWINTSPLQAYPAMRNALPYWQASWLALSPFVYLICYLAAIGLMQRIVRGRINQAPSIMQLASAFAYSLLPIALVYHVTHYYTLMQTQGLKVVVLASDPFGKGWNLFGTAEWFRGTNVPNPETVWHVQLVLIVFGHVISVIVAHAVALRLFQDRRTATLSQIPMLILMVLFTTAGLWILSEPIKPPV